ncbi:MAG: UDP-N-acetylmuramyl-tripeptide synthetase [Planctomycetales bacterium]|nr:UDP-N-acetylmuramyl-tripeptide synthetase [Planctomycetales bacterium]
MPANSNGVSIRQVLPESTPVRGTDVRVSSCCNNADQCEPGDVFVVSEDGEFDSFAKAEMAIAKGAIAVVTESILPVRVPQFLVNDGNAAFSSICHALAGNPSNEMCTVGITGSYGKTTTQMLLAGVLESAGHTVGAIGSLGCCDGANAAASDRSTPQAPELSDWLRRMHGNRVSHALIEASSESLMGRRLNGVGLNAAVLTNIRREHIDLHGSLDNLRNTKARIFESLKPGGFAVVNADDAGCKRVLAELSCPTMTYSMKHDAEVTATVLERHPSEQTFLLQAGTDSMAVRTHMIGDQHVQNCLAAACVGLVLGLDLPTIARGIESVEQLPTRLERIECGQGFSVFVDSSTSTESLAETLATLRDVTANRVICVVNPLNGSSSAQRAAMGRVLERFSDECILTEDVIDPEQSNISVHDVLDGFERPAACRLMPNRAKAICLALGEAEPGDTVLLAGNPRNARLCTEQDQARFFDRNVAQYWLQTIGASKSSPWLTV